MSMLMKLRGQRDAAERELIDEETWRVDESVARRLTTCVVIQDDSAKHSLGVIEGTLLHGRHPDYEALIKTRIEDFWETCRAVWCYEREWMFPHGFALVLRQRAAGLQPTGASNCQLQTGSTLGGDA